MIDRFHHVSTAVAVADRMNRRKSLGYLHTALWGSSLMVAGGCGGGNVANYPAAAPIKGSIELHSINSRVNGSNYPLSVYIPPGSTATLASLPVVYALDGDWWFTQLVDIAETLSVRPIVVGIGNNASRAIDFVPPNSCTLGGGGQVAYLAFIKTELIPYIERIVGGKPSLRALLGHSHGGSFVYYAMFADSGGSHAFRTYLSSDSSIACMPGVAEAWEASYASVRTSLPIRLHVSHTIGNAVNIDFTQRIRDRSYANLELREQSYSGTHTTIIPAAFKDALTFAVT